MNATFRASKQGKNYSPVLNLPEAQVIPASSETG
jgi:hypothetical protein